MGIDEEHENWSIGFEQSIALTAGRVRLETHSSLFWLAGSGPINKQPGRRWAHRRPLNSAKR
jgi:hypothetical protein